MLTNTNRVLYNAEYVPAYLQESDKKIRYKGSNYAISYEEVSTDGVWKLELDTGITVYLSKCQLEVAPLIFEPIESLSVGDKVLTYLDNQLLNPDHYNARSVVLAFLGNKDKEQYIKGKYKINNLNQYKLLRNNANYLASFLCELIRENKVSMLEEWQYLRGFFSYEMLQELMLVFSMFGIRTYIEKDKYWKIYFNVKDFLDNIINEERKYKVIPSEIINLEYIVQPTQSFKVDCKYLVVNTLMLKGD